MQNKKYACPPFTGNYILQSYRQTRPSQTPDRMPQTYSGLQPPNPVPAMSGSRETDMNQFSGIQLSDEQERFIELAKSGKNILVDACIGSGKTTAIQRLCNVMPVSCRILYLTYNRLLKVDAKNKIRNTNVTVTNYHGFASSCLRNSGMTCGVSDLVQTFNQARPRVGKYQLLVIDEYQDIELELAQMLEYIKESNPGIQLVAVGDMEQKIYDKTSLNVPEFIHKFLDEHVEMEFTKCFRLSTEHAAKLGDIWNKKIIGVNPNCEIKEMNEYEILKFLSSQDPKDILCLGSRTGKMSKTLNKLEQMYPQKYNKRTVYASIQGSGTVDPTGQCAIFTTFDSSKGLEKKICVVFDYTDDYWISRAAKPNQSSKILRNIFCVAASRGKNQIIFVKSDQNFAWSYLKTSDFGKAGPMPDEDIASMFQFKYREDIEECYQLLSVKEQLMDDYGVIETAQKDQLIDLTPCMGIYQNALFFHNYSIDSSIRFYLEIHRDKDFLYDEKVQKAGLEKKVLFLVSLMTNYARYRTQVEVELAGEDAKKQIISRIGSVLDPDCRVQVGGSIDFGKKADGPLLLKAIGKADAVQDDTVYTLRFEEEVKHDTFLECACQMIALGLEKGVVWNIRDNRMFEVKIPEKQKFLDQVVRTVTKGSYTKYYKPGKLESRQELSDGGLHMPENKDDETADIKETYNTIAVIDTETNWDDEVMSIGVVVADGNTFSMKAARYYIITPECETGGMYSSALELEGGRPPIQASRERAMKDLRRWLAGYGVTALFAYNASFDVRHLPELKDFKWHDIMKVAAYRQHNPKIPEDMLLCDSGRLKRNYGVEAMYRLLSGEEDYRETHNALADAADELAIMRYIGTPASGYVHCKL